MAATQHPWKALAIPFADQIEVFLSEFPEQISLRDAPVAHQLDALSRLLKTSQYTLRVAILFSPLLVDLCARWLDDEEQDELKFTAFALLVPANEELYPVLSQFLSRPSLAKGPLGFITRQNVSQVPLKTLHVLLLAYHRLLEACPHLYEEFHWPIIHLQSLCEPAHPDAGVRLLAIRCFAYHVGMNEPARIEWEEKLVGTADNVDPIIDTGFGDTVDVWVLPLLDHKRVIDLRISLHETFELCTGPSTLDASILSPRVAYIGGVLHLKSSAAINSVTSFVPTTSTEQPLHQIAKLLARRHPVLLSGPPSSGKMTLIRHLSSILHPNTVNQIVSIHLADTSLDARSLLGSYISSPTKPGTFQWRDGVLVKAMKEGKILVLENVDKASSEVLGTIWELVESLSMTKPIGAHAEMNVLAREKVRAKEGFALFATRSVPGSISPAGETTLPPPTFLGHHKWMRVDLSQPSEEDLIRILEIKFPRLTKQSIETILDIWKSLQRLDQAQAIPSARPYGIRDLMKWCRRIESTISSDIMEVDMDQEGSAISLFTFIPNPVDREDVFLEARDIFFASLNPTKNEDRIKERASLFAESLKISPDRVGYLLEGRTTPPQLNKSQNGKITSVVIDRFTLDASPSSPWAKPGGSTANFALHRPSLSLLAALAGCIHSNEPVLLTGETGTGKTTAVTYLASLLSRPLVSLNLSQQTESSDLIGGWKPVEARGPAQVLQERFMNLFNGTFSREKNVKYEEAIRSANSAGKWKRLVALWKEAAKRAQDRIAHREEAPSEQPTDEAPRKRRKLDDGLRVSKEEWETFERDIDEFNKRHVLAKSKAIFEFVEGPLVTALRRGHWILLDEMNLASAETLEAISSILQESSGSITLSEQGDLTPVTRHPEFRLFACMNPATDVGKKDLPPHIRSHLTEVYVPPPDANRDALLLIIEKYIGQIALADRPAIKDVAEFYTTARKMAELGEIADGANMKPHYSMRTLTRALTFAVDVEKSFPLRRALWEGILMAFSGVLEPKSSDTIKGLAMKWLLGKSKNAGSLLAQIPPPPPMIEQQSFVSIGPFWLERGPIEPQPVDHYILTPSVQMKLLDLARIILTRRFPVLIEGPTSSGKTSAIEYLARLTGHRFVRINNHEHTDIQEYIGSYITNPETGSLVFQDGLLVRALRRGDWIVLDELNLAPTDVLEALNRLLDDNRELLIPETGEVVKPHPHFMIFATQNPPGLYGGRKILSRAFRNRFLEVHFQDVPQHELEQIIRERCAIAPSYAQRIVAVFQELQTRRQMGRVFETKHGFATLRDLFRWAGRDAGSVQELAENGYMLLAERTRRLDDKLVVKEVIESVMKVRIDESVIYDIRNSQVVNTLACPIPAEQTVVWTSAMQRLYVLVTRALRHNEPVLLVGDTGSGKTSVCELYAKATNRDLKTLNCHQNTETADLLGGQRPIRNRAALKEEKKRAIASLLGPVEIGDESDTALLEQIEARLKITTDTEERARLRQAASLIARSIPLFEWQDGPLVLAMRAAGVFLLDEISLADDSVLERLNSVLEPSRTLILAEKGGLDVDRLEVTANPGFQLVATMNPGGDYGKKELSPALRNRFTEIWVPMINSRDDRLAIVRASWRHHQLVSYSEAVVDFVQWMTEQLGDGLALGLRDLLAWVQFSDQMTETSNASMEIIFHHAAHMVVLDGLASLPQTQGWAMASIEELHRGALRFLESLVPSGTEIQSSEIIREVATVAIGPFKIPIGPLQDSSFPFEFRAPTTLENARRVLRASQLMKPILLEGSPGVGKTSLVTALAAFSCQKLCRVNLSDQTDIMDLFGSDLPVEDGYPGEFAWKDAAFLQALQQGDWVLLDEMNLASQSVLEGLNAILDHRGTVYVPELGRSFTKHPNFRLFAAQNPVHQGGGRKGLPKSFVNRFTKVYMQELDSEDLHIIATSLQSSADESQLRQMIEFNSQIHEAATVQKKLGRKGSPWEFNLRDIMRWLALGENQNNLELSPDSPLEFVGEIYTERFRSTEDRGMVTHLIQESFGNRIDSFGNAHISTSPKHTQLGHSLIERSTEWRLPAYLPTTLQRHLNSAQAMAKCIENGWLVILVGDAGSGKTSLLRYVASVYGTKTVEFHANSATDTTDLLGSFEQEEDAHDHRVWAANIEHRITDLNHHTPFSTPDFSEWRRLTGGDRDSFAQLLNDIPQSRARVELEKYNSQFNRRDVKGRFIWVDGPLVQALKDGSWFVLDNANLCNPSVLDRLNSLCELGGVLTLTERGLVDGQVEIIKPHPNFRLFMTVDPVNGELSRAMRNRGLEISIDQAPCFDDQIRLDLSRRDFVRDRSIRLPEVPSHLSLEPLQCLLRLQPTLDKVSLDTKLSLVLQRIPRNLYGFVQRLDEFRPLADHLSSFLTLHDTTVDFLQLHRATLDLPRPFLLSQGLEPLLDANIFSRIRRVGLLPEAERDARRRELILALMPADDVETNMQNNDILTISQKLASNRAHIGVVPPEIKEIYPILAACRDALEAVVLTSSPVADFSCYLTLAELWKSACEITRRSILDYSLWHAILQEMEEILQAQHQPNLKHLITAALQNLRLKSGLAMANIWAYHKPHYDGQQRGQRLLQRLDPANQAEPLSTQRGQLRAQIFDAAALVTLEEGHVADQLISLQQDDHVGDNNSVDSDTISLVAILHLQLLGHLAARLPVQDALLQRFCGLMTETPGYPVDSTVTMHAIKWSLRANRGRDEQLTDALGVWMASIWEINAQGAEVIAQPTTLLSIMKLCAQAQRPMDSITSYATNLQIALSLGTMQAHLPLRTQVDNIAQLFTKDLAMALQSIKIGDQSGETISFSTANSLEALLSRVYPEHTFLEPLKTKLANSYGQAITANTQVEKVSATALGWVYLGMLMLHLYIPTFPFDPNAVNIDTHRRLSIICQQLIDEIELQKSAELLVTGNIENLLVKALQERLISEKKRLHSLPPSSSSSREIAELQTLLSELLQFHNQLLDIQRMSGMLTGLIQLDASAANREFVNQDSWSRFLERIRTKYTSLGDIIYPVVYWMSRIRFGASLLRRSMTRHHEAGKDVATSFMRAMIAFPGTVSATLLLVNVHPPPNLLPVEWASIRVGASVSQLRLGDPMEFHHQHLSNAFDQLFGLWLHEESRRKEEEKDKSSIYKVTKTAESMRSEEELEAEEFEQLFPEYGDIMEEGTSEGRVWTETVKTMTPYQLFMRLLSLSTASHSTTPIYPIALLHRWSTSVTAKLAPELDESSLIFELRNTFHQLQQLRDSPSPAKGYNFYGDSNVPQVHRAHEVVKEMNTRLSSLILAWPDQMVLQHLSERCQAIMQLDLRSTLPKVLSALEQLLVQSDDWQRFASKEVGIAKHQEALSALIIDWRRIELACWSHLLDVQAAAYSTSLDDWWYRIYRSVIYAPRTIEDENDGSEYLAELVPIVEVYLSSSPLGQFSTRLQLLEMFEKFISSMAPPSTNTDSVLLRIRALLDSLVKIYSRFIPKVNNALSSRREVIDKDIKSFVKLASWKDVNVVALKASAQRTHHQLHKCIRKFRTVLQEPVSPLLSEIEVPESFSSPTAKDPGVLANSVPSIENSTLPRHLRHLDGTLKAFHAISCGDKQPPLQLDADAVEDLSTTIISSIATLRGAILPKDTKNKTGWAKNLLTRKRKAFADLLKACKESGLPSQLRLEAQSQQGDRLWLLEHRSVMRYDSDAVQKMDAYFDRMLWTLPRFQASLSSHSEDVSTRDLTKLLNYTHGVFRYAIECRDQIHVLSGICDQVDYIIAGISRSQIGNEMSMIGPIAHQFVVGHLSLICHMCGSIQEILEVTLEFPQYTSETNAFDPQSIIVLQEQLKLLTARKDRIATIHERTSQSDVPILLLDERNMLIDTVSLAKSLLGSLNTWCSEDGQAYHICRDFIQSLETRLQDSSLVPRNTHASEEYIPERPISIMVVILQRLEAIQPLHPTEAFIKEGISQFQRISSTLEFPHLWKELKSFLTALEDNSSSTTLVHRLYPFLQRFNILIKAYLKEAALWTKSLFKLASILTSVGQTLADEGFCKPQESDAQASESTNDAKLDGTGVGEGTGEQDVSHEVEDESQVEGLQGDQTQPEEKKRADDKNDGALEMDQDFEGELESVEENSNEASDQSEDEQEEEVEERAENLDPADPDAVDEKLWEDKVGEKDKNEEMESTQPSKDTARDTEMGAKQSEQQKAKQPDNKEDAADKEDGSESVEDEEAPLEEGPDTDNLPNERGAPIDDHMQEEEILDLPDDLELNLDHQEEKDEEDVDNEFGSEEAGDGKEVESVEGEEKEEDTNANGVMDTASDIDMDEGDKNEEQSEAIAKPDEEQGQGQQDTAGGLSSVLENGDPGMKGETDEKEEHAQDKPPPEQSDSRGGKDAFEEKKSGDDGNGVTKSGVQEESSAEQQPIQSSQRTLAEALAEVQKRYQEIQQSIEQEHQPTKTQDTNESQVMEHVEEDAADTKPALGRANEDEVAKLRDLNIVDDATDVKQDDDIEMHEVSEEQAPPLDSSANLATKLTEMTKDHSQINEELDAALTREDIGAKRDTPQRADLHSEIAVPSKTHENITSEDVEAQLIAWHKTPNQQDTVDTIWRLYSSLTHELAWSLCEQLRLILEPTKATRLRGDYRTGKRLNMKKIIPYIASEYTKDKIWLRRTRPSQREYQILLALDDSRSMSESHSEHLAFETLALVSKALTRLEAGDISVVKFGETVDVLHGFDDGPFNDSVGAKVIGSFGFNQTSTDVLSLVETSLSVLQNARDKRGLSSASNLWQLEIIISDGICSNHEKLRATLRRAREQKIMVVFIIVDSLGRSSNTSDKAMQNSILSMKQVRANLTIERYLDTFPFEYYVVLRNVNALPEVLSGTLKQFFEHIAEE